MKKEEMVSVLAIAGVDPKTIDAMTEAYEMGFEHGARAYMRLTEAIECATEVAQQVGVGDLDNAKEASKDFWDALGKVRSME
jgi:predicted secreted protein